MSCFYKRVEWLKAVVEGEKQGCSGKGMSKVVVSTVESEIFQENKPIYTIDVLEYFQKLYPDEKIAFITGNDNDISKYRDSDKIKENYVIIEVKVMLNNCHSSIIRNSEYGFFRKYVPSVIAEDAFSFFNTKAT